MIMIMDILMQMKGQPKYKGRQLLMKSQAFLNYCGHVPGLHPPQSLSLCNQEYAHTRCLRMATNIVSCQCMIHAGRVAIYKAIRPQGLASVGLYSNGGHLKEAFKLTIVFPCKSEAAGCPLLQHHACKWH